MTKMDHAPAHCVEANWEFYAIKDILNYDYHYCSGGKVPDDVYEELAEKLAEIRIQNANAKHAEASKRT